MSPIVAALALLALSTPKKEIQLARTYYVQLCADCHGAIGKGDGPTSRAFPGRALDLTRIALRHGQFSAREVREVIAGPDESHRSERAMPIWREVLLPSADASDKARAVARHRILLLTQYLASLQVTTSTTSP